jgi:hypothetical protein
MCHSVRRSGWLRSVFTLLLVGHLLTGVQHYAAKHRFKCPGCELEFPTQAAVHTVRFYPISSSYVLTCPISTTTRNIASNALNVRANLRMRKGWPSFVHSPILDGYLPDTLPALQHKTPVCMHHVRWHIRHGDSEGAGSFILVVLSK